MGMKTKKSQVGCNMCHPQLNLNTDMILAMPQKVLSMNICNIMSTITRTRSLLNFVYFSFPCLFTDQLCYQKIILISCVQPFSWTNFI